MIALNKLKDTKRSPKKIQRVGRGPGSSRGKTCGRGTKGDKARSGYKRRYGQEGGQLPLFRKMPNRGFSNARFRTEPFSINLDRIEELFEDGEKVNFESLVQKGFPKRRLKQGLKILGVGELSKKVVIEATSISKNALKKLEAKNVEFKLV